MQPAEPFILQVTNSAPTAKSFYLSQGILYTRGMETSGQLRTGRFPAIGESAPGSLTATSLSSVSIEQFIGYLQKNPSVMYEIQATSTSPSANLNGAIRVQRQGAIKNDAPVTTPLRQYATQGAYNLQFQTLRQPKYFSGQDLASISVAGNSTLTLNLYPALSNDKSAELRTDVKRASRLLNYTGQAGLTLESMLAAMTVDELKNKVVVLRDIIAMKAAGATNAAIGAKYGFIPDNAANDLKTYTDELTRRGVTGCTKIQCIKAPCPDFCLNVPRDPNISPDFFSKVPPVDGKVHTWLPVIGIMAAGALFVWFVFFKSE